MTTPALIGLAAAAGWFCVFAGVQLFSLRGGYGSTRSLSTALLVSISGLLATIACLTWESGLFPMLTAMAMGLLALACLFVLYVPALYTVLTSLSVQTIILLRDSGGTLPEADLYARFAGRALFENRLKAMLAGGNLALETARYRLTSRGFRVARPFAALKALWRLGSGG